MLQRLTTALRKLKAGNAFENLLKEIGQIIYSLFEQKILLKSI